MKNLIIFIHYLFFGQKPDELSKKFLTRDSDGIALENMLDYLSGKGNLDIIPPAKLTFAGMGYEKPRSHITKNFKGVLPKKLCQT